MYSNWSITIYVFLFLFYSDFLYANLRDPTQPSDYRLEATSPKETEGGTPFTLSATLISEDGKFAIINNNTVKIGDMIGNQRVKSIEPYRVTLVGKGGEIVLYLFGGPIKESAK